MLWRTDTPAWSKFTPPTVVRGRVLVPSTSAQGVAPKQVLVYAIRADQPMPAAGDAAAVVPGG